MTNGVSSPLGKFGSAASRERHRALLNGPGNRLQLPLPLSCAIVEHIFLRRHDCASNQIALGGSFRRERDVAQPHKKLPLYPQAQILLTPPRRQAAPGERSQPLGHVGIHASQQSLTQARDSGMRQSTRFHSSGQAASWPASASVCSRHRPYPLLRLAKPTKGPLLRNRFHRGNREAPAKRSLRDPRRGCGWVGCVSLWPCCLPDSGFARFRRGEKTRQPCRDAEDRSHGNRDCSGAGSGSPAYRGRSLSEPAQRVANSCPSPLIPTRPRRCLQQCQLLGDAERFPATHERTPGPDSREAGGGQLQGPRTETENTE